MTTIEKMQAVNKAKSRPSSYEVIYSYKRLSMAMLRKYGVDWKYHVVYNYGTKQLGL